MTCDQITAPDRPWVVRVRGRTVQTWGAYPDEVSARRAAESLKRADFEAWVVGPDQDDDPE
jgi:hypothetical protein